MRQIWNGIIILFLILAVSFTICRSGNSMEFQHNNAILRKGDPDMPTLTLQVNMQRSEYLAGESLTIDLRLTNASNLPVEVPLADEESLFIYRLVSLEEKGPVYNFSQRQYERIIDPETRITREPEKQTLPLGESVDYKEDLARITTEPVLPGRYRLEVSYPVGDPTVYAPPKELVLKAPSIVSFAPLVTRLENTIIWGFAHAHLNGSGSIFQRDSVKGHPKLGVIYHRSDFEKKEQISSVALSLDSPIRPGPRWIAWIQEAKLFGIGSEAYVVGSHEFYLAYAVSRGKLPCIDLGHFHPTELIALTHMPDCRDEAGRSTPAGVYLARLEGSGFTETAKLVVQR